MTAPTSITTPATAYCTNCGDTYATLNGKCTRCGANTVRSSTMDGHDVEQHRVPAPKPVPLPVATPTRTEAALELPSNAAVRRWYDETQALAEGFARAAAEAETRAALARSEAERYKRVSSAFSGLLGQVKLTKTEAAPIKAGKWGRSGRTTFEACVDCGTTERKHQANGRCSRCDSRWRVAGKPGA